MDSLTYIDDYFKGLIQKPVDFEERLLTDKEFAEDVSFYLTMTQVARTQNYSNKKEHFKNLYYETKSIREARPIKRLWPYVASVAAGLTALIFGLYLYTQPADPAKLADDYIGRNLQRMEILMSGNQDLMQSGLSSYNSQNYPEALEKFEELIQNDTANYDAREDAGITALQMKDFNKALRYFKQVANTNKLTENRGKFYQALTLMKRNMPGDKEQSRILLEEVIVARLYGEDYAKDYLNKLNIKP